MGIEDKAPSLRDAISEAFDEAETPEVEVDDSPAPEPVEAAADAPEDTTEPAEASTTTAAEKARDEAGRFAKAKAAAKPAAKPVAPAKVQKGGGLQSAGQAVPPQGRAGAPAPVVPPGGAPAAGAAPGAPPALDAKPPPSWSPAARETWATLPPAARAEVVKREREVVTALQASDVARKFQTEFQAAVGPYEGMIRAEGGNPVAAAASLFQTAAALRTAPPAIKAQIVAGIIRDFRVDVDGVASALDGQPMPQQQQQQFRDPRFDQLMAQLQQAQQQRSQTFLDTQHRTVAEFEDAHEFTNDVREDMADVLELTAKRGLSLSLDEAYARAIALHPEISSVLQQREAAQAAGKAQASTQRARAAASSVRSQPTGGSPSPQSRDRRADLEAAIEQLNGR